MVQIALTRAQNANQNPQSGDAIDDQIPHICPPPLGLDIDRCNYMQGFFVFSCNVPQLKYQQHVIVGPLINMYINRHIFVLLLH